jgi:DNA mismatch repair ATPase MutS
VFDELYSGTNPDEAIASAKSFMEYIVKNKNVSCMLTTHFVKVCKKLKKNERIANYHMETVPGTETDYKKLIYKYKLKLGISEIKGGFSVLSEMNYPKEILDNTKY